MTRDRVLHLTSEEWPLVGRTDQVARVVATVRRALRGGPGPSGVVLAGAAGTGKTRLAVEVARKVDAPTARIIATASGASVPLGALAPLLPRDLVRSDLAADSLQWAADEIVADGHDPTVLVVDDLHLLDLASATVVLQLVLGRRVVLVASLRTGAPAPDAVTALWKDGLVDRIDLETLDHPAVTELLRAVLGGTVDGAAAHELWTTSAGNPLFLRELVVGAVASGALARDGGIWRRTAPLPTSRRLAELIADRLDGLATEQHRVLEVLAVGEPLGPDLLAPEGDTEVLDDLQARGLVSIAVDDRRCLVRFDHPLYGDVIRSQLPVLRARQINRSLADAVAAHGARRREDVLRVALWRLDGGGDVDPDLMLDAARRALFSHENALGERLARAAYAVDRDAGAGLLLGEVLANLGRCAEADEVFSQVATSAPSLLERVLASASLASNLFWGLGRYEECVEVLAAVEGEVGPGEVLDEILGMHATITMLAGHPSDALALADDLLGRATGRALVNASIAAAAALAVSGRSADAVAVATRAHDVHLGLGEQQMLAKPWIHEVACVLAAIEGGRLDDADQIAGEGYAEALERGEEAAQAWFALVGARASLLRGRPRTAAARFQESAARFADIGEPGPRRWAIAGRALALALLDDRAGVDAVLTELDAVTSPMELMEAEIARARAWWRATGGDVAGARGDLEAAAAEAVARGADAFAGSCGWELARSGDPAAAARVLAPFVGRDGALGLRAAHAAAVVAHDAEALERLSVELGAAGFELEAAEAAAESARCLTRQGARRRATAMARRADGLRASCEGAFTHLLAAPDATEPLTERQREIALLAAKGMSSKAIAEQLVLSRRTVDNNLQQAFAKLGIGRRTELSAALGLTGGDR